MFNIYAFVSGDGRIESILSGPMRYIECSSETRDTTHYFDNTLGVIREKEALNYQQNISGLVVTIEGMPSGVRVETNGMETVTDNEPLVIEYDVPGTYTISFSGHVRYLDHELEVTVGNS